VNGVSITFVGKSAALAAGTTSAAPAYPAGLAAGDLLVIGLTSKYAAPTIPSGWYCLASAILSGGAGANGIDTGVVYGALLYKYATGSETGTQAVSAGVNSCLGGMLAYRRAPGTSWALAAASAARNSGGSTAWSTTASTDPGLRADDLVVVLSAINADTYTYTAEALSASGATFGTATEQFDGGTTNGQDCGIVLSDHAVSAGVSTAAPTFTMTASGSATSAPAGVNIYLRLREVGPRPDGALTRNASNPLMANGSYLGTANTVSHYDKVGPSPLLKVAAGDYRAWCEMVALSAASGGTASYGQTGTFDNDTTVGYRTSTDGTTWTWRDVNADGDPDRILTPNTTTSPAGGSTAWMHGESVPDTVLRDDAAGLWKLWGHGGNNSGPRAIYYATSTDGISWTLQNTGQPIMQKGAAGTYDETWLADIRVVRLSATSYIALYRGQNTLGGPRILRATSSDGISWTVNNTTPVIPLGAAGTWDAFSHYPGALVVGSDGRWHLWYAGDPASDNGGTAIGYAWSDDQGATWTKGAQNPVLTLSASGLDSIAAGDTLFAYLDGTTFRVTYGAEKDVPNGGSGYFRGRMEASIVLPMAPPPFQRLTRFPIRRVMV
jgi:hypothetical protein